MSVYQQQRDLRDRLQAMLTERYPDAPMRLTVQVEHRSQRSYRQRRNAEAIPMMSIYHHDPDFFADGNRRQGYYPDRRQVTVYFCERLFTTMDTETLAEFLWNLSREALSEDTYNPIVLHEVYNVTRNGRRVLTQYPDQAHVTEAYSLA